MPVVNIHESAGRTTAQRSELVKAITDAFVAAYGVPAESVTVFFSAYTEEQWGKSGRLKSQT